MLRIKFAILSLLEFLVWDLLSKLVFKKTEANHIKIHNQNRVLWVGCDLNQDKSSLLPGLRSQFRSLSVYTDYTGKYSFMRSGLDFRSVNTKRLCELVDEHKIEVVFFQSWAPYFDYKYIKNYRPGIKLIGISWDDALPEVWLYHYYKSFWYVSRHFDMVLISNSKYKDRYRYFLGDVRVMPMGYSADYFVISESHQVYDLIFVGNNYGYRKRIVQMLLYLEKRYNLQIRMYGRGMRDGYLDSELIGAKYSMSRIVLGCGLVGNSHRRNTYKLRDMEALASKALYITKSHTDFISDSKGTVPTYSSIVNLKKLILYYLSHTELRENLALKQQLRARYFDWANVFNKVLFR